MSFVLGVLVLVAGTSPAVAAPRLRVRPRAAQPVPTTPAPLPPPKAWILVDVDTGNVLDAGGDRVPLQPASLTKVITALAAMSELQDQPDVTVPVSDRAAAAPAHNLNMKAGQVWPLQDALYALMLSSANDAAMALAERAGGTVEHFQEIFAATASALGMQDGPVLRDPAGLDDTASVDGGNLVSARDLAIAGRALLANPVLAPIVASPVYSFTGPDGVGHRLGNHNRLLKMYPGAIGMKTGYTRRAGSCLIAAATRDGRTMLTVVMNAPNMYAQSSALLDKGFSTPVAAEPTAERLPAVPRDLRLALHNTPTTAAPAPAGAGESAAAVLPPSHSRGPLSDLGAVLSSGPMLAVETLLIAIALLRLRVRRRRRRRHVRPRAGFAGPTEPFQPEAAPGGGREEGLTPSRRRLSRR